VVLEPFWGTSRFPTQPQGLTAGAVVKIAAPQL
jgi:hypothetical protein